MEKFIATPAAVLSGNRNWDANTGRLKQIFKGITGYDIMFEESRKDLVPANDDLVSGQSIQVLSGVLSNSIKKCIMLLGPRMM